jgi:hypothetical protein
MMGISRFCVLVSEARGVSSFMLCTGWAPCTSILGGGSV